MEAARAVFLERGPKATTALVAERAGVSEGTVFKRFASKDDLFRAAMGPALARLEWMSVLSEPAGDRGLEERLFVIGMHLVTHLRAVIPLAVVTLAARQSGAEAWGILDGPGSPPVRTIQRFTAFFDHEMRNKRVRRCDPELLARTFVGAIEGFVFLELTTALSGELPMAAESFVRGFVDVVLAGVRPAPKTKSK